MPKNSKLLLCGSALLAATLIGTAPAAAAGLRPGEYACAGSGGTILIGLGFKLMGDGTYTDLDGKTSGHVEYSGSSVRFVGGHLDGQTGTGISGGSSFQIHGISCSHN